METVNPQCPCPSDCERHGHCDACRAFHATATNPIPKCERGDVAKGQTDKRDQ